MEAFSSLIGHEKVIKRFMEQKNEDRIPHATLFVGPKYIGKSLLTRTLAHMLQGEDISAQTDTTIIDELPLEDSKEETHTTLTLEPRKTDSISINDTKLVQEKLQKTSHSKYNIAIINDIERMTLEAANALLKIIEEPPSPKTLFFLTTSSLAFVPKTIVSRCEIVEMQSPSWKEIESWLKENHFDLSDVQDIVPYIPKKPGIILYILRDEEKRNFFKEKIQNLSEYLKEKSPLALFRSAEKLSGKSDAEITIDLLNSALEHRFESHPSKTKVASTALAIEQALGKSLKRLSRNVTPRIAMECLALEIHPLYSDL